MATMQYFEVTESVLSKFSTPDGKYKRVVVIVVVVVVAKQQQQ
jgi:hypothetical protein